MTNLDVMAILFVVMVLSITIPAIIYHEATHMIPKETDNDN